MLWDLTKNPKGQYLLSFLIVITTGFVCYPLLGLLGYQTIGLLFLAIISFLPLRFGIGPVLASTVLSVFVWDFFFIPPRFLITISEIEDVFMISVYFIFAMVSSFLSARNKEHEKLLQQREKKALALYTLTQRLSMAASTTEVIRASIQTIHDYFSSKVAFYINEVDMECPLSPHPLNTLGHFLIDAAALKRVFDSQKFLGPRYTDDSSDILFYFPLSGPRVSLGVVVLNTNKTKLNREQITLLDNFISQITSAIEREVLNEQNKKTILLEESERLYKTILNSISHELMTPLSAIMSATDGLSSDNRDAFEDEMKAEYIREIGIAASRLNGIVKNLLDMSRLESGFLQIRLDWCDANDLFHSALNRIKENVSLERIHTYVPVDMPLFKADFGLLEQVLINLIQNAFMHNSQEIAINLSASCTGNQIEFVVSDDGAAIPSDAKSRIFNKFYRLPGSRQGGIGLGLSIAKGFIEAHKGTISIENIPTGGKRFIIQLPGAVTLQKQEEVE